MSKKDNKHGYKGCTCGLEDSGPSHECSGINFFPVASQVEEISLGDCYHTGLTYALGYHVGDKVELDDELFTNLDAGLCGGAMAALEEHRRQFCRENDVERFVVALKPVQILTNAPDEKYDKPENNAGCDSCGEEDRIEGDTFCQDCIDDDTCDYCCERLDDCECDEECCSSYDYCDEEKDDCCLMCDQSTEDCECDNEDELCEEFIIDTFRPMNAFARAKWLKAKKKEKTA